MATTNDYQNVMPVALRLSALFREKWEAELAPLKNQITEGNIAYTALWAAFQRERDENRKLQIRRIAAEERVRSLEDRLQDVSNTQPLVRPFNGDPKTWEPFLESIVQKIQHHPEWFADNRKKVLYLLEFMRGGAETWARMFMETAGTARPAPELDNFTVMVAKATLAWGVIGLEARTTRQLMELQMQSVEEKDVVGYNTVFGLLVGRVNWSDVIIMRRYLNGLPAAVQDHLKGYYGGNSLSATIVHVSSIIDITRSA